jgi:ribonuclease BN (tRNA processing enzyme)
MVQVRYLGTGEAFDDRLPNTSLVYEGDRRILLDCGYSIPHELWKHSTDPDWLDAIYLTHFHADHCFGLPAVLARLNQDGRTRPLQLFGGPGSSEAAKAVLQLGYPGMLTRLQYSLDSVEIAPMTSASCGCVQIRTARSSHSIVNHAVRLEENGVSVCYSGDGAPTAETESLYANATLLVHEAYYAESSSDSHASVKQVMEMAERVGVTTVHVLHLKRSAAHPVAIHVPSPGEIVIL